MNLILTIIGPDRPGLVEALSRQALFYGANWLDSRMAHLSGQFAGILRLEVEEARVDDLVAALRSLGGEGLTVSLAEPVVGAGQVEASESRELWRLNLVGQDRPGIVRQISQALAVLEVNVEELATGCESAPMSGETLFRADVLLRLPEGLSPEEVSRVVSAIAADLMIDVELVKEIG